MDIVLEVFDTLLFDRLYSVVLPTSKSQYWDQLANRSVSNATSLRTLSGLSNNRLDQPWEYVPSTKYLSLQPSEHAYSSMWLRNNMYRQFTSLYLITWLFGLIVYFVCASLSYMFIFDKTIFNHPKYLENQIRMEIKQAVKAIPVMALMMAPCFTAEVRGHARLYDTTADAPFSLYNVLQYPTFILFTDFFIYFIHRGLHHPMVYKRLHKPHHKWIVPTPYASHSFHPLDGFAQSIPYHVFPFILPLQKVAFIILFVFVNLWTIFIHDGEYVANSPIINGAACHTIHHLYFNYNYGQFTTLWDRLGGSYRKPNQELFRRETKFAQDEWNKQAKEMEKIVKDVEGDDDRGYVQVGIADKKTL